MKNLRLVRVSFSTAIDNENLIFGYRTQKQLQLHPYPAENCLNSLIHAWASVALLSMARASDQAIQQRDCCFYSRAIFSAIRFHLTAPPIACTPKILQNSRRFSMSRCDKRHLALATPKRHFTLATPIYTNIITR